MLCGIAFCFSSCDILGDDISDEGEAGGGKPIKPDRREYISTQNQGDSILWSEALK